MTITEVTFDPMRRGDSYVFDATVTEGGVALDLTNFAIWSTGKRNLTDTDVQALFQVTKAGGGITVIGANNNIARVTIPPSATSGLTVNTTIWVDVQITNGGNVYTVALGQLSIFLDVTQTII